MINNFQGGMLGCFIAAFVLVIGTVLWWISNTFSPHVAMLVAVGIFLLIAFLPFKGEQWNALEN